MNCYARRHGLMSVAWLEWICSCLLAVYVGVFGHRWAFFLSHQSACIDSWLHATNKFNQIYIDFKPPKLKSFGSSMILDAANWTRTPGSRQDASTGKACGAIFALCSWLVNFKERWFDGRPAGKSRTASWSQHSVRNLRKAAVPSSYRHLPQRFEPRACKSVMCSLLMMTWHMALSMSILLSNHREMETKILMAELPRVTQRWSNWVQLQKWLDWLTLAIISLTNDYRIL